MEKIFQNEFVSVVKTGDGFSWYDLTDHYNGFTGFTQAKRGLAKGEEAIKALSTDKVLASGVKMGTITTIFSDLKLKPHTYCSVN